MTGASPPALIPSTPHTVPHTGLPMYPAPAQASEQPSGQPPAQDAPDTRHFSTLPRTREWKALTQPGGLTVMVAERHAIDVPLAAADDLTAYSVVESHCDGAASHARDVTRAQALAIACGIRDMYVASGITKRHGHATFTIYGPGLYATDRLSTRDLETP